MSDYVKYKGTLKKVPLLKDSISLEDLCKNICDKHNLNVNDYCYDTYEELLLTHMYDKYIILDGILYEIKDLESFSPCDSYCHFDKIDNDTYRFNTQFNNGGTCLPEIIKINFKIKKERKNQ